MEEVADSKAFAEEVAFLCDLLFLGEVWAVEYIGFAKIGVLFFFGFPVYATAVDDEVHKLAGGLVYVYALVACFVLVHFKE